MKSQNHLTVCILIALIYVGAGCQSPPESRVVRLLQSSSGRGWDISVDGIPSANQIANDKFTNYLFRLNLRHGDIVLFGKVPHFDSSLTQDMGLWVGRYCESNKVAMFVYPFGTKEEFYSVPVYHWVTPFDNPRCIDKAFFYLEGQYLGAGMTGYTNVINSIERTRLPKIFLLGSMYDARTGFGPYEVPYEDQENILDHALSKAGTQRIIPSILPGL